tara:strand:+ start:493 stop:1269 length:777 start_codon:yes stop_codon:yes gene_type:complete
MLGLGLSVSHVSLPEGYLELSELANYADLDVWFDFSTLTGSHGDEVTAATNLGQSGSGKNINSNGGDPTLDTSTMNRNSIAFDGNDYLNMAATYTTTGKAHTFFMVFTKADGSNDIIVQKSSSDEDDIIKITGASPDNKNLAIGYAGESAQTVALNSTGGSTVSWSIPTDEVTVLAIRRIANGEVYIYAQQGAAVAVKSTSAIKAGANFSIGSIGGSATGADVTGNIAEVGIYDADIGVSNTQELCRNLMIKWGADSL